MTYADELVKKWAHVIGVHPIPTWTEPWALAYCAEVASRSELMVEIGTFVGVSAKVMLAANPKLHLWCVDVFTAFEFNEQICTYFLKEEIAQGRCELIRGNSDKAGLMLEHTGGKLDAIWIDGCHSAHCVRADIINFFPLVKKGGELFGHDYEPEIPNDVAQGVYETIEPKLIKVPVPRVWSYVRQFGATPKT